MSLAYDTYIDSAGRNMALKPHSNYVWTGSLWVPMLGTSGGALSLGYDTGAGTGGSATLRNIIDSSQIDSVAHDAADAGTPPKIGAVAKATLSTITKVSGDD